MNKEASLLISFLQQYDEGNKHINIKKAISAYTELERRTSFIDIEENIHTFRIKEADRDCFITITPESDQVTYSCNCDAGKQKNNCIHVPIATMYLLIRAHGVDFNAIYAELAPYINEAVKQGTFTATTVKGLEPTMIIPSGPPDLPKGMDWKTEYAKPQNIFEVIGAHNGSYPQWGIVNNTVILDIDSEKVLITAEYRKTKKQVTHIFIKYDRNNLFSYSCDCNGRQDVCQHVHSVFFLLQQKYGRNFFLQYKDLTEEKNAMLKPYGMTMADEGAQAVKFTFDPWGNLKMELPAWLWKADVDSHYTTLKQLIMPQKIIATNTNSTVAIIDFEVGFLFNMASVHFKTGIELETVRVTEKAGKPQVKKLSIHLPDSQSALKRLPADLRRELMYITDDSLKTYMSTQGHGYLLSYSSPWGQLSDTAIKILKRRYIAIVLDMWPVLCRQQHTFLLTEGSFSNANIRAVSLSPLRLHFRFQVTENERHITISLQKELEGSIVPEDTIKEYGGFLFEMDNTLYVPAAQTDIDMLQQFAHGFIKIPVAAKAQVIKDVVPLLQQKYDVQLPETMRLETAAPEGKPQVMLKELDNKYLVLQPQYSYDGIVVDYEPEPDNMLQELPDGRHRIITRNREQEAAFFNSLRTLHPRFEREQQNDFFFLPFEETMKRNWFIDAIAKLVEQQVPVLGMQELKKHKYNTNKPKWEMKTGSGIDWFDLQIEITFGDQSVSLRDVRKALLSHQNIVVLGDGTFGVLPEEWLKQYGLLLKMGEEQKNGGLRLSKLHYTLIDELHGQITDDGVLQEINDKKERLKNIGNIGKVKPGKEIKASLRPYQASGFQWFHMLDELGWGGCLADDMGLGKTLQAITFLAYLKKKYEGSTHLVICPTSLIYNWEAELHKFAPSLKYHIYYGGQRELSEQHFQDYDVVITSYGIIRNDLEELMKFSWHYIILDESQAIKNPDGQTNKALQLLTSKNRMILSGTPVQNNTFDLFAQFNFINPGLLGNREFFKTEFANPIDKNNDVEKSAQLRRLIYPFMLRRTKEQVATDLPDKTETVLWCEMGKKQRKVYDEYKNYYRTTLIEKIEEVGMAKAGMYVLEGLLRLRQICDSPQLVHDSGIKTTDSVKVDELLREIEQNAGGHKLLVFSQFTQMLHLIEENLKKENINYAYLDGSTPADKRREAVDAFQNDAGIRVFLISLKAGGVGLNLTAADYVYIVDPWWNPAVEQQAIDRTHRIGQVNKIFAYKMICKDTVEEKIIQLQQRKKQLANDLVTEDAGFIKKLNKEDIAFLFS